MMRFIEVKDKKQNPELPSHSLEGEPEYAQNFKKKTRPVSLFVLVEQNLADHVTTLFFALQVLLETGKLWSR